VASDYRIHPKQNLIVNTYSGVFTIEDVVSLRQRIGEDPEYHADMNVIEDVSRVEEVDADFSRLAGVSSGIIIKKGMKRCFVVDTDLQFGMARTYQMLGENAGHQFQIFRDYDEAYSWITQN
jgi:hypothetical protein